MRVALALGAGGARGYAHIGVIEVLEQRGFDIVSIAGSSMGAVVGGLHAAGQLDGYTEWVRTIGQFDLLRMLDPALNAPGAMRADKVLARVNDLLDGARIENLPIPFTAVATDLRARREVWFQRGPLDVAIRASIALPAIITPVVLNGRLLADGGLMDPLPIAPTISTPADATIAVSLAGARETVKADATPVRESAEPHAVDEWLERFRHRAGRLLDHGVVRQVMARHADRDDRDPTDAVDDAGFGELPPGLRKLDMMNLAVEAMQDVVTRYRLASYPPNLLIEIPKDACRTYEFHRAAEMIELGRRVTGEALNRSALAV